jgi:hypothetical protein
VYIAEFDASTQNLWPEEDLVSVDELIEAFDGFEVQQAEVMELFHYCDRHAVEWPIAVLVAQRPAG